MDKAKLDIEKKLVPSGANVVRHLSLPSDGKDLEWILQEMDKMDNEMGTSGQTWKQGKLSGAVYRMIDPCFSEYIESDFSLRRRRRTHQNHC